MDIAPDSAVGRNVRRRREALDFTVEQLAVLCHMTPEAVISGEAGLSRFTAEDLLYLTRALNLDVASLLDLNGADDLVQQRIGRA